MTTPREHLARCTSSARRKLDFLRDVATWFWFCCFPQRPQPRELRSHAAPSAALGVPNLTGVALPSVDGVYTPPDLSSQTAGPEKLTWLIYDAGLRRRRQRRARTESESDGGGGVRLAACVRVHAFYFLKEIKVGEV